jgi:hypothetical protein
MKKSFYQAALEARDEHRPNSEHFKNELGNDITLAVYDLPTDGVPGVMIFIRGPKSDTENHITLIEAEKLYDQLGDAISKSRHAAYSAEGKVALEAVDGGKKSVSEGVLQAFHRKLESACVAIGNAVERAASKGFKISMSGSTDQYKIHVSGTEPKSGEKFTATWRL